MKIKKVKVHVKSNDNLKNKNIDFTSVPENAIICNKLVRDKIIDKLEDRKAKMHYRIIEDDFEYFCCLINKFVEENSELLSVLEKIVQNYSSKNDKHISECICEEIADIMTVFLDILLALDIPINSYSFKYIQKFYENGSFRGRKYLSWYCEENNLEEKSNES